MSNKSKLRVDILPPNINTEAFREAEAAMREDDYQCYMLLQEMRRTGQLARLKCLLIKDADFDGAAEEHIEEQFDEIEARLDQRVEHCDQMVNAIAGVVK